MTGLMEKVEDKVDDMIATRPAFKAATKKFFAAADKNRDGRVDGREAAAQVSMIFDEIQKDLEEYGIRVVKPTKEEVAEYMKAADGDGDCSLDAQEFEEFYLQVVKIAALKSAQGFFIKYGWSMLVGILGVYVGKRAISSVPIAGTIAAPFLALIPALLAGPLLGVAVRYGLDKGDLLAAKKKLFPAKGGKKKA